jgi:hypothetical protein
MRAHRAAFRPKCGRNSGCRRADPAIRASSRRIWWCGNVPMGITTGISRWWSSQTRKRCCPGPPIGSRRYTNVLPVRSIAGRTPHKCASHGLRWHLQALTAGSVHESPYATASQAATDRPQYRASFREAYRDAVLGELADRKMAGRDQALPSLTAMAILEVHGQSLRRAGA